MLRFLIRDRHGRAGGGVFCVLLFPDSSENRWLARLPASGTRIRSRRGKVWIVDEVLQSGRETYTVFCVGRLEYRDALRRRSGGTSDLATELLEAARNASDRSPSVATGGDSATIGPEAAAPPTFRLLRLAAGERGAVVGDRNALWVWALLHRIACGRRCVSTGTVFSRQRSSGGPSP